MGVFDGRSGVQGCLMELLKGRIGVQGCWYDSCAGMFYGRRGV